MKIGDRVICNLKDSADYNKGGTIIRPDKDTPQFLINYTNKATDWWQVQVDNDGEFITCYHESELLPEDSLIKDH